MNLDWPKALDTWELPLCLGSQLVPVLETGCMFLSDRLVCYILDVEERSPLSARCQLTTTPSGGDGSTSRRHLWYQPCMIPLEDWWCWNQLMRKFCRNIDVALWDLSKTPLVEFGWITWGHLWKVSPPIPIVSSRNYNQHLWTLLSHACFFLHRFWDLNTLEPFETLS